MGFKGFTTLKFREFGNRVPFTAREAFDKANTAFKAAAPHADRAMQWGRRQQARVKPHVPNADAIEQWARANAAKYGWTKKPVSTSAEHLENILVQTVAAIRQTSSRRTRMFVNVAIAKVSGAMTVGGIAGLVTTFGAASTGTAIASLSGAAATTAQLYWLGSLMGFGVMGGSLILASSGIGAAMAAGFWGRGKLLGKPRTEADLQDHEQAILVACITLINAAKQQRESGQEASSADLRLVAEQALIPLVNQINQHWNKTALEENGKSECRPFTQTLAVLHRRKLDHCRTELGRLALSAMTNPSDRGAEVPPSSFP